MINLSDTIKDRLTMRQVAEYYLGAPKQGAWICPCHADTHPSMTVKGGRWKCWSCNEGGDVFDFVGKMYGLNFQGSVQMLARDFGFSENKMTRVDVDKAKAVKAERERERAALAETERAERELIESVCHKREILKWLGAVRWRKWSEVEVIVSLQNEIKLIDFVLDRGK